MLTFLTTLLINTASACTVCESQAGQQVRAGIFGDEFWTTLVGVVAPFPVLLAIIAVYNYRMPRIRRRTSAPGFAVGINHDGKLNR